jgi:hypothetical protein
MTLNRWVAEQLTRMTPPDGTPLGNLRHVVSAFAESEPDSFAIVATANAYPSSDPGVVTASGGATRTGLTYGDLRELLTLIESRGGD